MKGTLLLLDPDPDLAALVRRVADETGLALRVAAPTDEDGVAGADVIICADTDFDAVRQRRAAAPVIVHGDARDSARTIAAIKEGAFDFLVPPLSAEVLTRQVRAALRLGRDVPRPAVFEPPPERSGDVDRIIGQSPAMQDVYKAIGRIAPRDINVLITGESGTGKELVARAILHHSPRRDTPFLAVNCAAIPDTLLESELFGHEKGAFTGAARRHRGKFEQCDGGTLLLDEIGDIPLATQAKLLRVLQEQSFQRVGGLELIHCDVRIIAATHRDLETLIAEGRFRQDLYYRLSVANIHVPPLREREVDVVLLAHHFVDRYNADFETSVRAFAPETLRILLQHDWPGNVRELENAIRATLAMARGSVLRPEFLPESLRRAAGAAPPVPAAPADGTAGLIDAFARACVDAGGRDLLREAVTALERELIRAALRRHGGRLAPAARQLGISRATLRRKMERLGVSVTTT